MANRLETMSRGFLSGAGGPTFEPLAGIARQGAQGVDMVQQYAQRVAEEKAKQAAMVPQPTTEEEIRKQIAALGQAPDVPFDGGDYQYKATADPGSVGVAAIGIALQNWQKSKASHANKLREDYNRKLMKLEKQEDMILAERIKEAAPSTLRELEDRKIRNEREAARFANEQKGWAYTDAQRAAKMNQQSGGGQSSGGGSASTSIPTSGIDPKKAKWFAAENAKMLKDAGYDLPTFKQNQAARIAADSEYSGVYNLVGGGVTEPTVDLFDAQRADDEKAKLNAPQAQPQGSGINVNLSGVTDYLGNVAGNIKNNITPNFLKPDQPQIKTSPQITSETLGNVGQKYSDFMTTNPITKDVGSMLNVFPQILGVGYAEEQIIKQNEIEQAAIAERLKSLGISNPSRRDIYDMWLKTKSLRPLSENYAGPNYK